MRLHDLHIPKTTTDSAHLRTNWIRPQSQTEFDMPAVDFIVNISVPD